MPQLTQAQARKLAAALRHRSDHSDRVAIEKAWRRSVVHRVMREQPLRAATREPIKEAELVKVLTQCDTRELRPLYRKYKMDVPKAGRRWPCGCCAARDVDTKAQPVMAASVAGLPALRDAV